LDLDEDKYFLKYAMKRDKAISMILEMSRVFELKANGLIQSGIFRRIFSNRTKPQFYFHSNRSPNQQED
jgi:hypothetical protein